MEKLYAIERDGKYIEHIVIDHSQDELYGTPHRMTLVFNSIEKATEVAKVLSGKASVIEYIREEIISEAA